MSESDQKMKGLIETSETETCSSVDKNDDDKQKHDHLIHNNTSSSTESNIVMNLGLSLGGVLYGQTSSAQKHDPSRSSSPCNTGGIARNFVVGEQEVIRRETTPPVGPRPSSPSRLTAWAIASASRSRAIHHIRRDNTLFQIKGHEVFPQRRLFRPQLVPIRRRLARSRRVMQAGSIAYAKAIAQRKLNNIIASNSNIATRLVAHKNRYLSPIGSISYGFQVPDRRYHQCPLLASSTSSYGRPAAAADQMIMFQDILGPVPNYKRPLAAGINKFPNSALQASNSYAKPFAEMNFHNPLVLNSAEFAGGIMFQNGPGPARAGSSIGKPIELDTTKLIRNVSGSGSNGFDSNGKSAEFVGTNIQNNEPRGTSSFVEFAGTKFQINAAGSGSNEQLVIEFAGTPAVQNNQPSQQQQQEEEEAASGSSGIIKPVEYFAAGGSGSGSGSGSSPNQGGDNIGADDQYSELSNPPKRVKLSNEGFGDLDMKVLRKMPIVMAKGETHVVEGFLYKYRRGEVSMVCNCHGYFLNPTEFLQHAGATDLSSPMKRISVIPFQI